MENKNIKTEYPYAVVVRYDFDDDVGVYPLSLIHISEPTRPY